MKKQVLSVLVGIFLGTTIGLFAQSLNLTTIPSIQKAHKDIPLNLSAGNRLVCVLNPTQNPGGSILLDHTIQTGKTFSGSLDIDGVIQ